MCQWQYHYQDGVAAVGNLCRVIREIMEEDRKYYFKKQIGYGDEIYEDDWIMYEIYFRQKLHLLKVSKLLYFYGGKNTLTSV